MGLLANLKEMDILKKIWEWIVYSSADANKISLTVKAFLYGIVPGILFFSNVMNWQLDNAVLTEIIDTIASVIIYIGGSITGLVFLWGLVRKLLTTITGRNKVVGVWGRR